MIVRSSFKCATCGQIHTVRIGMGQEAHQSHRFGCMNCGEDMVVALNVDYQAVAHWTEALENAEHVGEVPGAPIMNVDANFIMPESERHTDFAFPRLTQLRAMNKVAEKHGSLAAAREWRSASPNAAASYCFGRKSWSGNIDSLGSWMTTGVCSAA
jgi:hypothetical protein